MATTAGSGSHAGRNKSTAVATADYDPDEEDGTGLLKLRAGDKLILLEWDADDWWLGHRQSADRSTAAWFPRDRVELSSASSPGSQQPQAGTDLQPSATAAEARPPSQPFVPKPAVTADPEHGEPAASTARGGDSDGEKSGLVTDIAAVKVDVSGSGTGDAAEECTLCCCSLDIFDFDPKTVIWYNKQKKDGGLLTTLDTFDSTTKWTVGLLCLMISTFAAIAVVAVTLRAGGDPMPDQPSPPCPNANYCNQCAETIFCSGHGQCSAAGICECDVGAAGLLCEQTGRKFYSSQLSVEASVDRLVSAAEFQAAAAATATAGGRRQLSDHAPAATKSQVVVDQLAQQLSFQVVFGPYDREEADAVFFATATIGGGPPFLASVLDLFFSNSDIEVQVTIAGCALEQSGFATCDVAATVAEELTASQVYEVEEPDVQTFLLNSYISVAGAPPKLSVKAFERSTEIKYTVLVSSMDRGSAEAAGASTRQAIVSSAQLGQRLHATVSMLSSISTEAAISVSKYSSQAVIDQLYAVLLDLEPFTAGQQIFLGGWQIEIGAFFGSNRTVFASISNQIVLSELLPPRLTELLPPVLAAAFQPLLAAKVSGIKLAATANPRSLAMSGQIGGQASGHSSLTGRPTRFTLSASSGAAGWEWAVILEIGSALEVVTGVLGSFLGAATTIPEGMALELSSVDGLKLGTHQFHEQLLGPKHVTPAPLQFTTLLGTSELAGTLDVVMGSVEFAAVLHGAQIRLATLLGPVDLLAGGSATFLQDALATLNTLSIGDIVIRGQTSPSPRIHVVGTLMWSGTVATIQLSAEHDGSGWEWAFCVNGIATTVKRAITDLLGGALSDFLDPADIAISAVQENLAIMVSSKPKVPFQIGSFVTAVQQLDATVPLAEAYATATSMLRDMATSSVNEFLADALEVGWTGTVELFGGYRMVMSLEVDRDSNGLIFAAVLSSPTGATPTLRTAFGAQLAAVETAIRQRLPVGGADVYSAFSSVLDITLTDVSVVARTSPPTIKFEGALNDQAFSFCLAREGSVWESAVTFPFDVDGVLGFVQENVGAAEPLSSWIEQLRFTGSQSAASVMVGTAAALNNRVHIGAYTRKQVDSMNPDAASRANFVMAQFRDEFRNISSSTHRTGIEQFVATQLTGLTGSAIIFGVSMTYSVKSTSRGLHFAAQYEAAGSAEAPSLSKALKANGVTALADVSSTYAGPLASAVSDLLTDKVQLKSVGVFLWEQPVALQIVGALEFRGASTTAAPISLDAQLTIASEGDSLEYDLVVSSDVLETVWGWVQSVEAFQVLGGTMSAPTAASAPLSLRVQTRGDSAAAPLITVGMMGESFPSAKAAMQMVKEKLLPLSPDSDGLFLPSIEATNLQVPGTEIMLNCSARAWSTASGVYSVHAKLETARAINLVQTVSDLTGVDLRGNSPDQWPKQLRGLLSTIFAAELAEFSIEAFLDQNALSMLRLSGLVRAFDTRLHVEVMARKDSGGMWSFSVHVESNLEEWISGLPGFNLAEVKTQLSKHLLPSFQLSKYANLATTVSIDQYAWGSDVFVPAVYRAATAAVEVDRLSFPVEFTLFKRSYNMSVQCTLGADPGLEVVVSSGEDLTVADFVRPILDPSLGRGTTSALHGSLLRPLLETGVDSFSLTASIADAAPSADDIDLAAELAVEAKLRLFGLPSANFSLVATQKGVEDEDEFWSYEVGAQWDAFDMGAILRQMPFELPDLGFIPFDGRHACDFSFGVCDIINLRHPALTYDNLCSASAAASSSVCTEGLQFRATTLFPPPDFALTTVLSNVTEFLLGVSIPSVEIPIVAPLEVREHLSSFLHCLSLCCCCPTVPLEQCLSQQEAAVRFSFKVMLDDVVVAVVSWLTQPPMPACHSHRGSVPSSADGICRGVCVCVFKTNRRSSARWNGSNSVT